MGSTVNGKMETIPQTQLQSANEDQAVLVRLKSAAIKIAERQQRAKYYNDKKHKKLIVTGNFYKLLAIRLAREKERIESNRKNLKKVPKKRSKRKKRKKKKAPKKNEQK